MKLLSPIISAAAARLLDLLYPRICLACRIPLDTAAAFNEFLCQNCAATILLIKGNYCFKCGRGFGPHTGVLKKCNNCYRGGLFFDRCVGAAHYEGAVKTLVHNLKFNNEKTASLPLAELIAGKIVEQNLQDLVDVVVPVPVHKNKLIKRKYNQAELLAHQVARRFGLPLEVDNICRAKDTPPQFALSRLARFRNLRGSFCAKRPDVFLGKSVLLVDDVLTTGATAAAVSRLLKQSGAHRVLVAVAGR